MVANATKTVEYAFITDNGNLITGTSLAASTRYDFTVITITLPENTSRSFKSVILECHWRDAFGTAYNIVGWRLGIKLGATAYSDVDYTPTAVTNTGDHEAGIVIRDVTDYFNSNFGAGTSQTAQVGFACATATAAAVQNITAKLIMTYEYDNTSGSTVVKTVRIPIQSHHVLLTTAMVEIGTTGGTTNAPANQIPLLDTFLPETNKNYKEVWFELMGNDGGAATTAIVPWYQIDSGASASRCSLTQSLNTGTFYYDLWLTKYPNSSNVITDTYAITTDAAHALKVSASPTSRLVTFGGLMCVTYEYDNTSGSVMNSVILPLDTNPGYVGGTSASNANYYQRDVWVEETNPNLVQSGVLFYEQTPAGATFNVAGGDQTARPYTLTALVNSGGNTTVHRTDHSSGWALARGKNSLNIRTYAGTISGINTLVGLVYLNYTSASFAGGESKHNHTTEWFLASQAASGAVAVMNEVVSPSTRTPSISASEYFLNGIAYEMGTRLSVATNGITLHAEKMSGEFNGDGWRNIDAFVHTNDGELATYNQIAAGGVGDNFFQDTNHANTGMMNIETPRGYRVHYSTASLFWMKLYITYHGITFDVSGSFVNPSGTGSEVIIDVYRSTDDYWSGSTISTSSGSYIMHIFDNAYPVYATASQDSTHIGRSASALAV